MRQLSIPPARTRVLQSLRAVGDVGGELWSWNDGWEHGIAAGNFAVERRDFEAEWNRDLYAATGDAGRLVCAAGFDEHEHLDAALNEPGRQQWRGAIHGPQCGRTATPVLSRSRSLSFLGRRRGNESRSDSLLILKSETSHVVSCKLDRVAGRWLHDCRCRRALSPSAQGDDGDDARGPGGEIIQHGNEFKREGGQQEPVKTQHPDGQQHHDDVNGLIRTGPAKGAGDELYAVGGDGDEERKNDAAPRQNGRPQLAD